jgi:hypothetical protein
MKVFADVAADFVPAVERVFGTRPRVLDGSRAVLLGTLKLQLEAGERELWLIERHGALEHRLGYVPVRGSIEAALQAARRLAVEQAGEKANRPERTRRTGPGPVTDRPQPRPRGT